jgi:acyl-coenzyme A thioesterase PaaI-like protein
MTTNPFAKVLPPFGGDRNLVRAAWNLLKSLPGGTIVFSRLLGRAAPYTGSIGARVVALRDGHAETVMADRRAVRNHLRCIHAVALVNLAELTGNAALAYSMPDDARFIVAGLSIDYRKKARGAITASCDCPIPRTNARRIYDVPVILRDAAGEEVARATLRTMVGPKPGAIERDEVPGEGKPKDGGARVLN